MERVKRWLQVLTATEKKKRSHHLLTAMERRKRWLQVLATKVAPAHREPAGRAGRPDAQYPGRDSPRQRRRLQHSADGIVASGGPQH